jgi:pilus assembly protein CpaE
MNRYDKRITITPEKVGESLKTPIAFVIPFEEKIVTNSINRGLPFFEENETYPISKAILNLAQGVRVEEKTSEPAVDRLSLLKK